MKSSIRAHTIEGLTADAGAKDTQEPDLGGLIALTPKVEAQALLSVLALGQKEMEAGRVTPVADVVTRLRAKRLAR